MLRKIVLRVNNCIVFFQAEKRIVSMTSSRSDWCISRQRMWGVPIPVFYHVETKEPLMNEDTIDHIKCRALEVLMFLPPCILIVLYPRCTYY